MIPTTWQSGSNVQHVHAYHIRHEMKHSLLSSSNIPQIEHQTDRKFKKGTKRKGKTRIEDWKYFRGQEEKTKES